MCYENNIEELYEVITDEIIEDKKYHVCEYCDDYSVCEYMTYLREEPCESFEWNDFCLYKLINERMMKENIY